MKRIIKKRTHYSVMLMRDDREVRSFRMRGGVLRFLVILLLLLLASGGAGIGMGVYFWKQIAILLPRYQENERILADARIELTELRSFKAVTMAQKNGTQPLAQNNEVGALAADPVLSAQIAANATGAVSSAPDGQPVANATLMPEKTPSDTETAALSPPSASALPQISQEECPVRINEFSAQSLNNQTLRIRYNLSVPDGGSDGRPVSGLTRYVAILADNSRVELIPNNPGGSRFSINYMKPMFSNARLPQGHLVAEVRSLDVLIETTDGTLYGQNYAFPSVTP
jgi:hypothetical protein